MRNGYCLTQGRRGSIRTAPRWGGFTWVGLIAAAAILALVIAFLIPVIQRSREQANLALCKDHLRQIGIGLLAYAPLNNGFFPVSDTVENPHADLLHCLATNQCVGDMKNYYCPSQSQSAFCFSNQNFQSGVIGYYYYSALRASANPTLSKFLHSGISWPHILNATMNPKSWVMSDIWYSGQPTAHAGYRKGLNYLMLDGSVNFVGESPRQAFH
jgi:prepilin-type processing-associated H-X9-DG protein